MLSKKIEEILNAQVKKEGYSSNLYLAMASWAEVNGYPGVSDWFYAQSDEERMHMLKFIGYINERGGHAIIPDFEKPTGKFKDIKEAFDKTLGHEEFITSSINEIVALCIAEKDFTTQNWVQWFVNEQIEEEKNVHDILDRLKLLGEQNLYLFDRDIMSLRATAQTADKGV